jgi:hypothetical protein
LIWTPTGNPSLAANDRSKEMFPSTQGFMQIIAEVKNIDSGSPDNILTLEAMKDIQDFQTGLAELEMTTEKESKKIKF